MKKFVLVLASVAVVFCFSCGKHTVEGCGSFEFPPRELPSIEIVEPVLTNYRNGIYSVYFTIESDFEGEAFIAMVLRQAYFRTGGFIFNVDTQMMDSCYVLAKGFGNSVVVEGYQIRSYHPFYENLFPCPNRSLDPTLDFPVFLKKIKVPKGSFSEKINIRLPIGVKECFGELVVFRNNKAFEESMKTKISLESFTNEYVVPTMEIYQNFFPDSSLFSYLITSRSALYHFSEVDGYKEQIYNCLDKATVPTKGYKNNIYFFGVQDNTGLTRIFY